MVWNPKPYYYHSVSRQNYVLAGFKMGWVSFKLLTAAEGKSSPTKKLEVQLEQPATAMAAGRGPWPKSSATINQGMGPGPISKKATNSKMAAIQIKLIQP